MSGEPQCEVCGSRGPMIQTGPFAGSRMGVDYCQFCSKNLCDDCLKAGRCRESEDGQHRPSEEE